MCDVKRCVVCGKEIKTNTKRERKYCSKKCKDHVIKRQGIKRYVYTCIECGKEYHPKDKRNNKFCSKGCTNKNNTGKTKVSDKQKFFRELIGFIDKQIRKINICKQCGKIYYNENGYEKECCSQSCCSKFNDNKNKKIIIKKCKHCGATFSNRSNGNRSLFCSIGCCEKHSKKVRKIRKRINNNDKTVGSFSLYHVLVRDKYKCGICGDLIDVSLPINNKMSATMDHIVPISKGGDHSWNNVQAAHMHCNSKKGSYV